ncbi:MAG: beta-galactosidase GalB [Muribaculaceae bacterium]
MGNANVSCFDEDWLFMRYGLQPDGTIVEEPEGLEKADAADAQWQKLDLPHDYAITGPFRIDLAGETGKLPYQGIGWYRKHFNYEKKDGERLYIDFDGAMAHAKVWLNGRYVGTWPYGYNSFRLDLTSYVKEGDNVLAVRLDTENWESRWYSGAGIYRHVWLVRCHPVHVAHWGTYITTPVVSDSKAVVNNEITVENYRQVPVEARIVTRYYELDGNDVPQQCVAEKSSMMKIHACSHDKLSEQVDIANPKRWDITSPNRYLARTEIYVDGKLSDTYNTPFGIRTIEFSSTRGFMLNGRRVPIYGVCLHHDLGSLGAAFNKSALERQLRMMQDMGCNSIRTSHNPPAPELLELADKMGFVVWDEAFDAWSRGKRARDYNRLYREWHEKDLLALVHRDRNHPSVIIWSIGNEVMEQRNIEMTKHLADIMRKADPTRPISNGYNDPDGGREVGAVAALDLMGVNYFFGRQAEWDADPRYADMPTIGSETSSCVSSRGEYFFGEGEKKEYQNWQITSYDSASPGWGCAPDVQFRTLNQFPNLLGEYVWTGFDYLGEPTPYNSAASNLLNFRNDPAKKKELEEALKEIEKKSPPSRSSYFGIVDLAGFPKDRYYLYQSQWRPDLPMTHILPHWNWPERVGEITPVHVYTSGDEAELFLNGKSQGRKTKTPGKDFRLVWDNVRYQPGVLKVVSYKNGKKWSEAEMRTTGKAQKLALSTDRTEVTADGQVLAFISLSVCDKAGRVVPRSNPNIRFSVEGAGEIVSTDNGNAIDFTPFQSHERNAYNGHALVIVKAKKGETGKIVVRAESQGLRSASIVLESKE